MNHADSGDLIAATIRDILDKSVAKPELIAADLYESGWRELVTQDDETANAALRILFEESGRQLHCGALLDFAVVELLGLDATTTRVIFPADDRAQAPAGEHLGLVVGRWPAVDIGTLVVLADGIGWIVDGPADLDFAPVAGLDESIGLGRTVVPGRTLAAATALDPAHAVAAVALGRTALAQQLVGISATLLDLAVDYAITRQQFGGAIGRFQAVKHMLADVLVLADSAQRAVDAVWPVRDPADAALAKALAGETLTGAARAALQVFGAMGFTWEHSLHRYIRRGITLDTLLGSSRQWCLAEGNQIMQTNIVARLGEHMVRGGTAAHV
jgi:hypothetical protein